MISKDQIQHIAKLARLDINDDELGKLQEDLSSILDYVGQMSEADVNGVEPLSHAVGMTNAMREDKVEKCDEETINKMMEQAPETKEGWVKVKAVL